MGWHERTYQASNAFGDYAAPDGSVYNGSLLGASREEIEETATADEYWALLSNNGFTYAGVLGNTPCVCKPGTPGNIPVTFDVVRFERAIDVIQRAWRRALYDSTFRVCRARLQREFDELMQMKGQ